MTEKPAGYEEALRQGHSYSWDQRWPEAISEFQKAVDQASTEPAPYAGLGMAYFELGDLEKALENYKMAARYSRGDMIYLKHVADVQERLGQIGEAGQTYMAIGEIQLRRKKLDEAVGHWLRAVRLEPNLVGAHQRLATVYQRQGLMRNAIREYLAIARIYNMRGEKEKAIQVCRAALKLDPRNADVLTAVELIQQGEEFFFDEEEVLPPSREEQTESVTDKVQRMAEILEAEQAEMRAVQDRRGGGTPGQLALQVAREQLAKEIFEEDEDEESFFDSGKSMSKLERDALISQALDFQTRDMVDEAVSCYERAIEGGATSTAAHYCLGYLYQERGQQNEAIRELQIAMADPAYQMACHFTIGQCYKELGETDKAVDHLVEVLRSIDLSVAGPGQNGRVNELYNHFVTGLVSEGEPERSANFIDAVIEFLDRKKWESHVQAAREKLDSLSAGGRFIILGDMLTAGSAQVLESLALSQEYARRAQFDTAVEEAYWAIQLSPNYLPGHLQLAELMAQQDRMEIAVEKYVTIGRTFQIRGDINGAVDTYERAIELSPLDLQTREQLIDLLTKSGQKDRAVEHYLAMGDTYYNLAQVDEARATYVKALRLTSDGTSDQELRTRLLKLIADIDMQRLDWRRALAAMSELSASNPDNEEMSLSLIDLLYKVDRPDSALQEVDRLFVQLVRSGRGTRIEGILEELIEQHTTDVGLIERLTRLYAQQGRRQEAINLLDQLGEAQLDAGNTQAAIGTIEKILELNPPNVASYNQLLIRLRQDEALNQEEDEGIDG